MRISIDTNAYTAFCRGEAKAIEYMEAAEELLVPAIVIGELISGFVQGSKQQKNMELLDTFLAKPGVVLHSISQREAHRFGLLVKALRQAGTPIPSNDIWIAATALCADAALLSRDNHFQHVPGLLVIPF